VENIVIIGSGFSALATFLKFKKYNPIVITATHRPYPNLQIRNRRILNTNKIFSNKAKSSGTLLYNLKNKTKLHDRLSVGGNSNIWGGFINISSTNREAINQFKKIGISFDKLIQKHNGYLSNNNNIRQLRDLNNKILDTSNFLKNFIPGFVETIEFKNQLIKINYFSNNYKMESLIASKLFLGISFPQLIDLLYRSKILTQNFRLTLSEFEHKFIINNQNSITIKSDNDLIIKYDFIRAFKHFFGLQKSIDKFSFAVPIYIDQIFSKNKIFLKLDFNFKDKIINQNTSHKFGQSIHYCNLYIDEKNINEYLSFFSSNLFGVSAPFVDQKKPGPISNDIIENVWDRF
tara:strand:- start:7520 stop:8560 length:1041 start_codon:yes stop_codon:yes gene_type:complete